MPDELTGGRSPVIRKEIFLVNLSGFDLLRAMVRGANRILFVCFFTIISCGVPDANDSSQLLGPDLRGAGMSAGSLEHWADPSDQRTIETVLALPQSEWQVQPNVSPTFGYTPAAHWFRVSLKNTAGSAIPVVLRVGFDHIDRIDVAGYQAGEAFYSVHTGRAYPFEHRPIPHRQFAFSFDVPPGASAVYIAARSEHTLNVPVQIMSPAGYRSAWGAEQTRMGFYFGAMALMFFLNCLFYYVLRSDHFLYYLAYVIVAAMAQVVVLGLGFKLFWPDSPWWNAASLTFFTALSGIGFVFFCRHFLGIGLHYPRFARVLDLMILLLLGTAFSVLFVSTGWPELFVNLFLVLAACLCMGVGIVMLVRGNRVARFYVAGWGLYFILGMTYQSQNLGLLPNRFFRGIDMYEFLVMGVVLEMVFFPVAIADRIRTIVREHAEKGEAPERRRSSRLTRLDLDVLRDRLMNVMREDRPYRDNLTLGELARMVGVGAKDLSEFLNEAERKSFYRFVNEFRVREACDLLTRDADRKILEIAHDVGFQSLSAFNNAFQKTMAMSPRDYRNRSGTA